MRRVLLVATLLALFSAAPVVPQARTDWTVVEYGPILDGRRLTQSGEPVGRVLQQLGGRPVPPPGQRPDDRRMHSLIDPWVEPYGFVLSDALDTLEPPHARPLVEVAQLWQPGEAQPAWVDLLRSRRLIVESDGAGTMRVVLPWDPVGSPRQITSTEAAQQAWDDAWPILRHVLAAERRRLDPGDDTDAPALDVRAYPFLHQPARSMFLLGKQPHRVSVDDTRASGERPPLDLAELRRFLASGWTIEGGKLDASGRLTLLGSQGKAPATLLGRPLTLADLAVAHRAAAHGGIAEPYMSLDRGHSPWQAIVSYGGRLRDTSLGWVSLLCDVRFKTFSMGLGIEEGQDLRDRMRGEAPDFRTHVERFASDPSSAGIFAQQTRLWFYPDRVELTVAPQSDVLAMRRVRMSAASERLAGETFGAAAGGDDPPWTRATIASVNEDYDALARVFPELADLDQVVRLLSLFTWLDQAARSGARVPDLDALLAVELPALPTPRTFPQMLSFNAMPAAGEQGVVESIDRVEVVEALEMLNPRGDRMLEPAVRLQRALDGLDRGVGEEAAFIERARGMDPATLDPAAMDLLAYRAQRLRMHRTVLGSFDPKRRAEMDVEAPGGKPLRVVSVGVGGLDLGMGEVLDRARSRSLGLVGTGAELPSGDPVAAREISDEQRRRWREASVTMTEIALPAHGEPAAAQPSTGSTWIETSPGESSEQGSDGGWLRVVHGAAGPEASVRRTILAPDGKPLEFERYETGRLLRYRLQADADAIRAVPGELPPAARRTAGPGELPDGLALLSVDPNGASPASSPNVRLRLQSKNAGPLNAATPRWVVQRLLLGRRADLAHDPSLPGIAPLPPVLGEVESMMVLGHGAVTQRPWQSAVEIVPGEQDPARVAAAINAWWDAADALDAPGGAVLGVDPARSPGRWAAAPRPGKQALLVLPDDGFPQIHSSLATGLREAWSGRVSAVADRKTEALVIVVSAEAPGPFAERLRRIAAQPAMKGALVAGWSLSGPVRDDLAAWILAETQVAGVGFAEGSVVTRRTAGRHLREIAAALKARGAVDRVESIPGPFLWHF